MYAKALAETDGNEDAARARYIKLRVETMKAEADLADFVASEAETKSHRNNSSEDSDSENLMVWVFVGFCVVILVVFLLLFAAISQV